MDKVVSKSRSMNEAIADKIEAHPQLLEIPLANIKRWLAQNHSSPRRLEQWRRIILDAQASEEGLRHLLAILRLQKTIEMAKLSGDGNKEVAWRLRFPNETTFSGNRLFVRRSPACLRG